MFVYRQHSRLEFWVAVIIANGFMSSGSNEAVITWSLNAIGIALFFGALRQFQQEHLLNSNSDKSTRWMMWNPEWNFWAGILVSIGAMVLGRNLVMKDLIWIPGLFSLLGLVGFIYTIIRREKDAGGVGELSRSPF